MPAHDAPTILDPCITDLDKERERERERGERERERDAPRTSRGDGRTHSVEAPALEAVAHKFAVGGLEARASKLEREGVRSRVEQRHVVCGQAPAEGARVLTDVVG